MERASVNGIELEYELRGSGEPVVLLHGGLLCDENAPLMEEKSLVGPYKVLNYHRRGFAGSTHPEGGSTIDEQAADCLALMDEVGFETAHLIGHSLGGVIALQVALDAPARVHSLALLEPALMGAIAKAEGAGRPEALQSQQEFVAGIQNVQRIYAGGDARGALLAFLETRAGGAFREVLDFLTETGEFEQAIADAGTFINVELPAAFVWPFTPEHAANINHPLLSVLGSHSPERAQKVHTILTEWLPQTQSMTLEGAEHALPLMDPPGIAKGMADWLRRNPMSG